MPENLLTDAKIRSAKPTDRDWKLSDGGGLFLLVKPTGGKLWRWKYRLQGKENLFAIGGFPQVSLAEARAAREKARALVKQGTRQISSGVGALGAAWMFSPVSAWPASAFCACTRNWAFSVVLLRRAMTCSFLG